MPDDAIDSLDVSSDPRPAPLGRWTDRPLGRWADLPLGRCA